MTYINPAESCSWRQVNEGQSNRPPRTLRLLVGLVVVGLLASSCASGTSQAPSRSSSGMLLASHVVGPAGMKVRFQGGWVDVPAAAVARRETMHVRTAPPLPSGPAAMLMHSLGGVSVDLSGLQPLRPLTIALSVPRAMPSGVRPQALFVATVPGSGAAAPGLLATRYDSSSHMLVGQADHLSSFYSVWLDGPAVVSRFVRTMAEVLQIRAPQPACVSQHVLLPDGSTVQLASGTWSAGTDPLLWGCLTGASSDPGHVMVDLTDNRPMGYSIQVAPGASVSRDPPSLDSATARLLFDTVTLGKARDLELLTAASTVHITVPDTRLPPGTPVIVAAVRVNQAVVAASAAQTAFLITEALLEHGASPSSKTLKSVLDKSGNLDCLHGAVTTVASPGPDQIVSGTQLGLRCLGTVLKGNKTSVALAVLGVVTSFFETFTGMVNLLISDFTGADTFTVALQRHPAAPIPTDQTYWANRSYTVACPGITSQPFSVTVQNGQGQGAPQNVAPAGFDVVVGGPNGFAAGDLTGDGQPEVALVVGCHPSQTSPGNFVDEVQIFTAGPNGPTTLARLTPPFPVSPFPPVFGGPNPVFEISDGTLVTSAQAWAPGDCHACASIFRTVSWHWNGQSFVPTVS
jgi:hypothetical protein